MQVSHVETDNTHAILGGGKAQAFGMSESAEFFTVLSDTLYRDKKRAVVREIICNAFDAHIAAGNTDTPVEITLTEEKLVIKDFGLGIPHDKIRDVYCIYGASTKVNNENETGGFGLGSKAPFAYSDHFSITNCHDGRKVTYAISRGGAETQGVPDFRPMTEIPSEQSGVTITVPMRSKDDMRAFKRDIVQVVSQGGMNADLNDVNIKEIDYTEARKTGFMVVHDSQLELGESSVWILYGTVLYPVATTDETTEFVSRVKRLIPADYKTILIAPPNSIGVTPSREALSYTDRTIATVNKLADKMHRRVMSLVPHATKILLSELVKDADRYNLHALFQGHGDLKTKRDLRVVHTPLEISMVTARHDFWHGKTDYQMAQIIGPVAARRFGESRRSLRRMHLNGYRAEHKWQSNQHFARKEAAVNSMRLHIRALSRIGLVSKSFRIEGNNFDSLRAYAMTNTKCLNVAENVLIIAQSRAEAMIKIKDIEAAKSPETPTRYIDLCDKSFVCVIIPANNTKLRSEMRSMAENYKIDVFECKRYIVPRARPERPKDAFISLRSFATNDKGFRATPTLKDPTRYIQITQTIGEMRNCGDFYQIRQYLLSAYEDDIAVVRTVGDIRRVKAAGAKDVMVEMWNELRKTANTHTTQIAALLCDDKLTSDDSGYWRSAKYTVKKIIQQRPAMFFEFVSIKTASKQKVIERAAVMRIIFQYINSQSVGLPNNYPLKMGGIFEIYNKAKLNFQSSLPLEEDFEKVWENIGIISQSNISISSLSDEQFMKILRVIKRTIAKGDDNE